MARYGFFRPYKTFRGGVHPEAWHLSYGAVSLSALELLTPQILANAVRDSEMLGKDLVVERVEQLYLRYIANVDAPGTESTRRTA
jgi:hypothetical protein